ncbi:unnamed protein product [Closterium sp. NIES-65]|nr:unnamed protein product [Closterium sp. NIES-65]
MADSDSLDRGKKRSAEDTSGPGVVFRLLIPAIKMGPIIGNKGANIKSIRDDSGARIKITNSAVRLEERVAIVSSRDPPGTVPTCAETAFFRLYPFALTPHKDTGDEVVLSMLVPDSQAGVVLGKGGASIKEMREASGAHIRMDPYRGAYALPHDRLLQITGSEEQVERAVKELANKLREHTPKESLQELEGTAGPTRQIPMVAYDAITQLPTAMVAAHPSTAHMPSWTLPQVVVPVHDPYAKRRRTQDEPPVVPIGASQDEAKVRAEVRISSGSIGAVLGHGGHTIKNIRNISGAIVRVAKLKAGDTSDRLIEIQGTQAQVSAAQQLIQACLVSTN